ncbi:TNF receptor-associated factor 6-B [Stylophora pistillata]|uniref:TNF receptor-associated factor 6-B n=1 Tax=Stylophora pistillata TaxID=50429 RepID=A0A2B4SA99_STYPI|nr:TNF receptor-associated factor 6-B [Stylophora pistillata]
MPLYAPFGHIPNELDSTSRSELVEELKGYDEDFDPPLEKKHKCSICHLGLREPVQTECGHRLCRKCLEPLMSLTGVDTNFSTYYSQVASDTLEDHSHKCLFFCVECEHNCGVQPERKNLQYHMESECLLRKILCEHCGDAVSWCEVEKHFGSCLKYPEQCNECKQEGIQRGKKHFGSCLKYPEQCNECKQEGIQRGKMKFHLQHHCPNVKIKCPFNHVGLCEFEGFQSDAGEHLVEEHLSQIMDLMKIFLIYHKEVMQRNALKETEVKLKDENNISFEKQANWNQRLESEVGDMQETLHEHSNEIDLLRHQLKETLDRVHKLKVEVKLLQQGQQLCNGQYIWKIENMDRCCQDAVSGVSPVMYSPGFYTSPCGYKMCLRINLNGVKSGVGTHVALHVHMMRGDHDKHLEWPFSKGFTLSIVDQSEGSLQYHITKTVVTKPEPSVFQRPVPPWDVISSEYSGYENFAPIDKIHMPQYSRKHLPSRELSMMKRETQEALRQLCHLELKVLKVT